MVLAFITLYHLPARTQIYELDGTELKLSKEVEKPSSFKCGTFGASSLLERKLATGNFAGERTSRLQTCNCALGTSFPGNPVRFTHRAWTASEVHLHRFAACSSYAFCGPCSDGMPHHVHCLPSTAPVDWLVCNSSCSQGSCRFGTWRTHPSQSMTCRRMQVL